MKDQARQIEALEAIVRADPSAGGPWRAWMKLLVEAERWPQACEAGERTRFLAPLRAEAWLQWGEACARAGHEQKAREALGMAERVGGDDPALATRLRALADRLGEPGGGRGGAR